MSSNALIASPCNSNHSHGESSVICEVHGPQSGPCALCCLNQTPKFRAHDYFITDDGYLARRPKDIPAAHPKKRQWYESLLCGRVVSTLDDGSAFLCELKHGHKDKCSNKAADEKRREKFRAAAATAWQPAKTVPAQVANLIRRKGMSYAEAMAEVLERSEAS